MSAFVEAFDLIAQLGVKLGAAPLHRHEGCWAHDLDGHWRIVVNGHTDPRNYEGIEVPPFHCYVEFNGFPAGTFSPYGGTIAAGRVANEATFVAALRKALG